MDDGYWASGYWTDDFWLGFWPLYWSGSVLSISVHDCSDTNDLMV